MHSGWGQAAHRHFYFSSTNEVLAGAGAAGGFARLRCIGPGSSPNTERTPLSYIHLYRTSRGAVRCIRRHAEALVVKLEPLVHIQLSACTCGGACAHFAMEFSTSGYCSSGLSRHSRSTSQPSTSRNMLHDSAMLRPMETVKWKA